jgi:hypothetical protein
MELIADFNDGRFVLANTLLPLSNTAFPFVEFDFGEICEPALIADSNPFLLLKYTSLPLSFDIAGNWLLVISYNMDCNEII